MGLSWRPPKPGPCHHEDILHELSALRGYLNCELPAIREQLGRIESQQEKIMSEQSQLDAVTGRIETDVTAINAGVQQVTAEIQALAAANPTLDFTSVLSSLNDLDSATQGVTAAGSEVPPATPPASS